MERLVPLAKTFVAYPDPKYGSHTELDRPNGSLAPGPAGRARLLPMDAARATRPVASLVLFGGVFGGHRQLGGVLVPQGLAGASQDAWLCIADPQIDGPAWHLDLFHGLAETERTARRPLLEGRRHGRHKLEHDDAFGGNAGTRLERTEPYRRSPKVPRPIGFARATSKGTRHDGLSI